MPTIDVLFALLVAIAFSLILVTALGKRGPGPLGGFLFFFAVLFFSVWAVGIWVTPFGPSLWSQSLLVFVIVGAVFALFLAAVVPTGGKEKVLDLQRPQEKRAAETVKTAFGVFFWILILVLLGAIISRYVWWVS